MSGAGSTKETVSLMGHNVDVYSRVPTGFKRLDGATNAPTGMEWYTNGKSRFSGERAQVLVKTDKSKTTAELMTAYNDNNKRKSESYKRAIETRYDKPQQQSASSKRLNNRLHNRLKGYL